MVKAKNAKNKQRSAKSNDIFILFCFVTNSNSNSSNNNANRIHKTRFMFDMQVGLRTKRRHT